jgi:hypothetical protein
MTKGQRAFLVEYCKESAKYFKEVQKDWNAMIGTDLISWVRWYDYLWDSEGGRK